MYQVVTIKAVHEEVYSLQETKYDFVVDAPSGTDAAAKAIVDYRASPHFTDPMKGRLLDYSVVHIEPCPAPAPPPEAIVEPIAEPPVIEEPKAKPLPLNKKKPASA